MHRIAGMFLFAAAALALPSPVRAAQPRAAAPPGWSAQTEAGTQYFFPPQTAGGGIYEAVFPTLAMHGTLRQTTGEIWRKTIGGERIVDARTTRLSSAGGAPAYEVLVATLDSRGKGVYRIFVVKRYGDRVAAGELRFEDVRLIEKIGKPALESLLAMHAPHAARRQRAQGVRP